MDLLIVPTPDGGDILVSNGQAALDPSPRTSMYLSMFGGNEDDSGDDSDNAKQWWGNLVATDPDSTYRARTQWALSRYPPSMGNLVLIEEAATMDLAWMRADFDDVAVSASMTAGDKILILVELTVDGETTPYEFPRNWTS